MNPLTSSTPLDLALIRERLSGLSGKKYWRSLEEVAQTPEFQNFLHREFPANASEFHDPVGRREFLKLMAASLALAGLTSCTKQPLQKIVPYIEQPESVLPGKPLQFATAMTHNGFAQGILVTSYEGHPTKIEGNPDHPISRGRTNVFMQAALLDLYDPDRAKAVTRRAKMRDGKAVPSKSSPSPPQEERAGERRPAQVSSWPHFTTALHDALEEQRTKNGDGLRILTETVTSPTLAAQLRAVLKEFPGARWHQWQPINRDNVYAGARLAFGENVATHYAFDKAEVILSLDADFLFSHPASLTYAREFVDGRRVSAGMTKMNRLYYVGSAPGMTSSMADHRLLLRPSEIEAFARAAARLLGQTVGQDTSPSAPYQKWLAALIADLKQRRGASIVVAGEEQPPTIHALAHAMNYALGNVYRTVFFSPPGEAEPIDHLASLRGLVEDLVAGKVEVLVIIGGNPVFTAPAEIDFARHLTQVATNVHLSTEINETSILCEWHIPETHFLESWSDTRAFDGTGTIQQPLIAPLYGGISVHQLLGEILETPAASAYEVVREHWRTQKLWPDFESGWQKAVHDGVIAETRLLYREVNLKSSEVRPETETHGRSAGLEICFRPDPSVWDGRFANNGWLQELAKPVSKLTWDNAALISAHTAQQFALANGDIVDLRVNGRSLRVPVWISPGQADACFTLHIGNGRSVVGKVGEGAGYNCYPLRLGNAMWSASAVELHKIGENVRLAGTQLFHTIDSEEREILRTGTLKEFLAQPDFVEQSVERPGRNETLYEPNEHQYSGYKWGMVIDLNTCIGCNACVLGCQAENNIPVVGKAQVAKGRAMQWIRIDTYFEGGLENPQMHHMPVPCMHCENAPCELVCPVAATVHDHEGLNVQIYNRCIGTRYCSNNCPYKVRRFNFFQYADYRTPSLAPMRNPQVTVRWRGVMEKCTYCIQRVSAARIMAKEEDRAIRDGEVLPACAQACPTDAIVFGDLNDPNSRVSKLRKHALNYEMLGQLNTRPRTTYLARLENPNPELNET